MPLDRVVDDTDGVLTYRGSWSSMSGSTRQWGGNVHVTTSVGSSVSFQFQGFILRVFHTIPNGSGDVQVDISIDGGGPIRVSRTAGSEPVYADVLYETTSLSDFLTHTVLITYRGGSAGAPFLFDRVQVESDQGVPNVSSWAPGSGPVDPGTTTTPNPPTTTIGGGGGSGGNNGGGNNGGSGGGSSGGGTSGGGNNNGGSTSGSGNGNGGGSGSGGDGSSGGGSNGGGSQNGNGSGSGQTGGSGSNVRPTTTTDITSNSSSSRTGTLTPSPGTTGTGQGQAGGVSTLLHTQTDTIHSTATNGFLGDQNAASERTAPPIGPIVGGVLGFVVILALVIFFLLRRAKRRRQGHSPLEEDPAMVENAKPRNPVIPVPFALDIAPREESVSPDPRSATVTSEKAMRFHQDLQLLEAARRMEEQGLGGTMLTTGSGTSISGTSSVLPLTAAAGAIAGSTVGASMSMYHSTDEEGGPAAAGRTPAESSGSPGKLSQEYTRSISPGYTSVSGYATTTDGDFPPAYAPHESRHSRTLSPDTAGPSVVPTAQ